MKKILTVAFFLATSSWANSSAPLLERSYSPGLPTGGAEKYVASQCQVFDDHVQMITVNFVTGERAKSQKEITLEPTIKSLIVKAAQGIPKIEVGPTDVPSTYYYAWVDEDASHRYFLRATGALIGENSAPEATQLIGFIDQICQVN